MNIKGLKLTKEFIDRIDDIDKSNFEYKGLETFVDFAWDGFDPDEFFNLANSFEKLSSYGCFENIPENHLFIFNFATNVTEMDIVTILLNESGEKIFLDIEVKNGDYDKIKKSIDMQMGKRSRSQIKQLIKEGKFILIGMLNNEFYKAVIHNDSEKTIDDVCDLKNTLSSLKTCTDVESILYKISNIASIDKICGQIRNGKYDFYDDTEKHYRDIINSLEYNKAIFVYGNAGTGKSVLALRLFFEQKDSHLLMLNSKLYNALRLGGNLYSSGRSTFNSSQFIRDLNENVIAIVDECQRLSLDEIEKIISKSKVAVFFGDEKQGCFKNGTALSGKELERSFKDKGCNVYSKVLKKAKRYSDDADEALNFLTCDRKNKKRLKPLKNYKLSVTYKTHEFLSIFDLTQGIKKIYSPFTDTKGKSVEIGGRCFECASSTYDDFSLVEDSNQYGSTYHALSFDVDSCFVYLPKTKLVNFNNSKRLFTSELELNQDNFKIYTNELNVLFTRGRKSLMICVEDINVYLYLNKRIMEIARGVNYD